MTPDNFFKDESSKLKNENSEREGKHPEGLSEEEKKMIKLMAHIFVKSILRDENTNNDEEMDKNKQIMKGT